MQRYAELDSLRGLASVTVMIHHAFLTVMTVAFFSKLQYTPVHIFWAGHSAVIFFFVLSGFVLSLPFINGKKVDYFSFLIKRVARIYIPYICAVLLAIVFKTLFSRNGISQLSDWFNRIWVTPLNKNLLLHHVLLLGDFKNYAFDPVIWSLIHEMRISIVFPLLILIVIRCNWRVSLLIGFIFSLMGYGGINYLEHHGQFVDYGSSYLQTLHYIFMFMVGALLAKHKDELIYKIQHFHKTTKYVLLSIAILCYTYPYWFPHKPSLGTFHLWIVDDWGTMIGAGIFIVISLAFQRAGRFLKFGVIHHLGKISYSLYLYHAIILMTAINLLYGKIPMYAIWLLTFVSSIFISTLAYYIVEIASIKIGKWLTTRLVAHASKKVRSV